MTQHISETDSIDVLALPLDEAIRRLSAAGFAYEVQTLLPPRDSEQDFAGRDGVRKYVVRQQKLTANKIGLTIVFRYTEGGAHNGSEN